MFDFIIRAWKWIKSVWLAIIRFVDNVVSWFEDPNRLRELEKDMDNIAVVVKERLDDGNYRAVKCLYNKRKGKIVGREEASNQYIEGMESGELDKDTRNKFGNKDMIVLE